MKILFAVALICLLSSCAVMLPSAVRTSSFVDFTKYESFYLSQSPTVDFKYKPLGVITSFVVSGNEPISKKDKSTKSKSVETNEDAMVIGGSQNTNYVAMSAQDAINLLYEKAKSKGANGIIGIKIDFMPDRAPNSSLYFGYSASGMAIKME